MNDQTSLETLTDRQKIWLSQISYLDINKEGRYKIENGGLTVSELKEYLDNPKEPFCGNAWLGEGAFNFVADGVVGKNQVPSKEEMLESIIKSGLGDLKITNISEEQKLTTSGFQALTIEDSYKNVGISYRGSDFDFSNGGVRDWVESDFLEYFTNDSTQRNEALEYFKSNKSNNGNNYLYGHSLGGNLTSHVYLENHNEIQEAFTINGNPINQKLLDTPEKVEAFNDSKKYNCNVICGDIVGHLKSCESYKDNVNYIRNNDTMKSSAISAHLVQSSTFDQNGNFIYASEEEMKERMGFVETTFTSFVKKVREAMNDIGNKLNEFKTNIKHAFGNYKKEVNESFEKKFDELNYAPLQNEETLDDEIALKEFQNAAKIAENSHIEKLKRQINEHKLSETNQINNIHDENIEENYSHLR